MGKKLILKASAGTGKTYRLSLEYIASLMEGIDFKDILVMTFTKKATAEIKERILKAREIQKKRYGEGIYNGTISQKQIQKYCKLSQENREYFKKVIQVMEISARGYDKILKVARTIADLAGSEKIEREHLMEAVSFRNK